MGWRNGLRETVDDLEARDMAAMELGRPARDLQVS